jgi:hypothetical protein
MDALQPQARQLQQPGDALLSRRRAGAAQQIVRILLAAGLFTPAAADLETPLPSQAHHLLMVAALAQGLAQLRPLLAQRHKGIQLGDLGQELLQIGFGHGHAQASSTDFDAPGRSGDCQDRSQL